MSSRLTTRVAVSAMAAAAFGTSLVLGGGTAAATPQDDQFTQVVEALGIPVNGPEQAIKLGNDICALLTQNGAAGPNPVPAVRGVVTTLTKSGLEKGQAVPVLRAAVSLYCPEYGSIVGR
jgi:hypothetical protein